MKCTCLIIALAIWARTIGQDVTAQLFHTTMKILAFNESKVNGKEVRVTSIGTGFFLLVPFGKDTVPCLVTNAHVVKDYSQGILVFNVGNDTAAEYGETASIKIPDFNKLWISHPSEDLAVLPVGQIINHLQEKTRKRLFYRCLSYGQIPSKQQELSLAAIEDVMMIGYPKGLSDTVNNLPIVRKGITATPIYLDYNNEKKFLLDIPIYSGSSGSPIIIYQTNFTDKRGMFNVGTRFFILGVAVESKEYIAKGTTVSKHLPRADTETWLPYEVAIIIKSSVLLDLVPLLQKNITDSYTIMHRQAITKSQ